MTRKLEDSGERREFSTGAVRDRGDLKPRPDLISPHANWREGMINTLGSIKYAIRNWEKGMPISECLASAQRHIEQYKRGDTDEDHLAQARWNLGAMIHFEEEIRAGRMDPSLDDMPKYAKPLPSCPRCGGATVSTYHPETGAECYCDACGLCSLDSWPSAETEARLVRESQDKVPLSEPPTFYIAGPMRRYKGLNFPAFDEAAERGRRMGYTIISPADLDREHGIDPEKNPEVAEQEDHLSTPDLHRIIRRDLEAIMALQPERGDGIAVLRGWRDSVGATAEVALARWLGLKVVQANDFHTHAIGKGDDNG